MHQFPIHISVPFRCYELAVDFLVRLGHYDEAVALTVAAIDCIQVYDAQAANHVLILTISDDEIHADCTKTL